MDGFGAHNLEIVDGVDDVIVERSRQPVRLGGAQSAECRSPPNPRPSDAPQTPPTTITAGPREAIADVVEFGGTSARRLTFALT